MRALIQRVTHASVTVEGQTGGRIAHGLVVLLGVTHADTNKHAQTLAAKIAGLRIFADDAGKFNLSLLDVQGGALVVSQFTLYANAKRGRRPDLIAAARPEQAEPLVEYIVSALQDAGVSDVQTGVFGAHMLVEIHSDGPVTILLDTDDL
ncbi:MAG: D-tyrosyl-tRNA(Tyr) deacylase [Chloroflexi bacterium]|nr:D-tyrosyl-tRNA(Tyr) deacylase [Chloroflexota bacterium]